MNCMVNLEDVNIQNIKYKKKQNRNKNVSN